MTTNRTTTVLITGANKGLGAETARRLAALGWTVWLAAREEAAAERAAQAIRAGQPDADLRVVQLDVTSEESVAAAYAVVSAAGTGLDVLVNNAGVATGPHDTLATVPADFLPVYG